MRVTIKICPVNVNEENGLEIILFSSALHHTLPENSR